MPKEKKKESPTDIQEESLATGKPWDPTYVRNLEEKPDVPSRSERPWLHEPARPSPDSTPSEDKFPVSEKAKQGVAATHDTFTEDYVTDKLVDYVLDDKRKMLFCVAALAVRGMKLLSSPARHLPRSNMLTFGF